MKNHKTDKMKQNHLQYIHLEESAIQRDERYFPSDHNLTP